MSADSYLRWLDVEVEGVGTLRVRELLLDEQDAAQAGNMAAVLFGCVHIGDKPYFESIEEAGRFPSRLANPLALAVMKVSGLGGDEDTEGKD